MSNSTVQSIKKFFSKKPVLIALGSTVIFLWQYLFFCNALLVKTDYRITGSVGMYANEVKEFMYFYYHLGLFPVMTKHRPLIDTEKDAKDIFLRYGHKLQTENNYVVRNGDWGRFLLFWPDAFFKGHTKDLSTVISHFFAFTLALIVVFIGFCWAQQSLLGILLVLFVGSNPLQLFEVYRHYNIFSWNITSFLLLLGINIPLIAKPQVPRWYIFLAPFLSAFFLATVKQIRPEPLALFFSIVVVYLTYTQIRWRLRIAIVALCFAIFFCGYQLYQGYFQYKIHQATKQVERVGGSAYKGFFVKHHPFWHNFYIGMGDFDTKYGYKWDDRLAYKYAYAILKSKHNFPFTYKGGYYLQETYDKKGLYRIKLDEFSQYQQVVKEKVLTHIKEDPLWYLTILIKRCWHILAHTTPVRITVVDCYITIPMHGVLLIPTLCILCYLRQWMWLKLIIFSLPLSVTAFLIYSGGNMTYYSCYHIVLVALYINWLWQFLRHKKVIKEMVA